MNARILVATLAALAAGCTTDESLRYDGVSPGAGNAIAANTVMQMVDPWPAGVEQTDLKIPADRDQYRKPAQIEADDGGSIVTD